MKTLTLLVHGESGVGKSWLGETAPGPRLYLDVEGRAVHLTHPKIWWDPRSGVLPEVFPHEPRERPELEGTPVTTDTTIVVDIRNYPDFEQAYKLLASGAHYFRSVIVDSLTELQQRCLDMIAGVDKVTTPAWGELLRNMEKTVRDMRDLRTHPTKPIDALVVICGTEDKAGKMRPMLQGKLSLKLPYHFDTVGFLNFEYDPTTQVTQRVMAIQPYGIGVAKDDSHTLSQRYGLNIINPNVEQMLYAMNGAA